MSLFALASSMTNCVNFLQPVTLRRMKGVEQAADYSITPCHEELSILADIQPGPGPELQLPEGIARQGECRTVYLHGTARALSRPLQTGGDSLLFEGSEWLVTRIIEQWSQTPWCRLIVTRQTP